MTRRYKTVYDRREGNWVVLIPDEGELGEILVPAKMFTGYAREGDVINVAFTKDSEDTQRRRERVSNLLQELLGNKDQ